MVSHINETKSSTNSFDTHRTMYLHTKNKSKRMLYELCNLVNGNQNELETFRENVLILLIVINW